MLNIIYFWWGLGKPTSVPQTMEIYLAMPTAISLPCSLSRDILNENSGSLCYGQSWLLFTAY